MNLIGDTDMSTDPVPELPRQRPMVAWYDPAQLCRTGINVLISLVFGRHSDYRLIEALWMPDNKIYDYSSIDPQKAFTVDFVADLGDGWNPTYAVAYYVSQPRLMFQDEEGNRYETERGSVLVFGGDAVYPTASRIQYQERLIAPYKTALCESADPIPISM